MSIESIIRRVQALQEKTLENGCTEAEALSAAEKVVSLMTSHGLSLTDVEIEERKDCEQSEIDTGRQKSHAVEGTMNPIAEFCDVKVWRAKRRGNAIRYVFFGFPEDVAAAKAMYGMIKTAMDCALINFKAMSRRHGEPTGRVQSTAFLKGMSVRIGQRLLQMKAETRRSTEATTGRDLVVVKGATVDAAYNDLNMKLRQNNRASTYGDAGAFAAGKRAGDSVGFNKGVSGGSQARLA